MQPSHTNDLLNDPYVSANPENLPFWEAAIRGELLGKFCNDCRTFHWYPRPVCPFCHSPNTIWKPLSGEGRIYSCSTLLRASPPYTVAYVTLKEGPTLLTNLVDMSPEQMHIDAPVHVVFRPTEEGRMAPKFTALRD